MTQLAPARTTRRAGRFGVESAAYVAWTVGLTAVAAVAGVVVPGTYHDVPPLLRETWRAQDVVTIASLVVLVRAWRRARSGSLGAHLVVLGLLTWLAYCYAHLAFAAPFTPAFPLHVAVLALAAYGLLDGLARLDAAALPEALTACPTRAGAWFLIVSGIGIAGLWLSDVVVGLAGGTPTGLHLELLPNPTWVLDLGWIIPMAVGAGVLTVRGRRAGLVLGSVTVVALAVLCAAMLVLTPVALAAGLGDDPALVPQLVAFTVVFTVLGAVEAWLLWSSARRWRPARTVLRPGWWTEAEAAG